MSLTPPTPDLLVVLGATATGKTRLGVHLAQRCDGEIISADSRQVFRGMNIGAGKDLDEYGTTPFHLIDIADPGREFSLFAFHSGFLRAFAEVQERRRMPILVGGTGLYLDAVLRGYQLRAVPENPALRAALADWPWAALVARLQRSRPDLHNHTDLTDRPRLIRAIEVAEGNVAAPEEMDEAPRPRHPLVFGVRWPRPLLRERITTRLRQRLEAGLVAEVAGLLAGGVTHDTLERYGLEYRFVSRHLRGELDHDALFAQLNRAIHKYAKRQETWFRRMERHGVAIHWLDGMADPESAALAVLERIGSL